MKVYVSATYRDLKKHRLAVATVLRRMGHEPIGMEDYVAEGMRPLARCLADVKSCDAYIGIVAWRYGYIPKETTTDPGILPSGATLGTTSITEFEFRLAIQAAKPVLMFLLDPEAEWPSNQLDALSPEGDQGKAIAAWRQEIGQKYLVSYFRTSEELAGLVAAAVYRTEMSRQMILESLQLESPQNENLIRDSNMGDTGLASIEKVILEQQALQGLRINIGEGLDWWMTRLYFLASLASDLTAIQEMVFVGASDVFIGIVSPVIVKERLARNYPMLKQYEECLAKAGPALSDLRNEVTRRRGLWNSVMQGVGGEGSVQVLVKKADLEKWLSPYIITHAVDWDVTTNAALQIQRLLDWPQSFVPVVENGKFTRIVDKGALAEQVARLFVREQVSRALSTVR